MSRSPPRPPDFDRAPTSDHIEAVCDLFEQELLAGRRPTIADFLGSTQGPERESLERKLAAIERNYLAQSGATATESRDASAIAALRAGQEPTGEVNLSVPPATVGPAKIGRYRVLDLLGIGGFGAVYLAHDDDLDRPVAIKSPRLSREHDVEEFVSEARSAARLKHPGIVTIYDVVREESGGCFIAMEYVEGHSLARRMASAPLPPAEAAGLIAKIADAVHFAHKAGLVHRDLKPANILIDAEGKPRVADFGLALHERTQRSAAGQVAGTPAFMAPEQVRGEAHRLDGRADIWSLGVILYEMLTGRRPFRGHGDELFDEIENRDPKPPRQIDDRIPAGLERVCLKCLEKKPTARYATALDLATDLREWLAGADETGQSSVTARAGARSKPQSRSLAFIVTAAGLLLALCGAVYLLAVGARPRDADLVIGPGSLDDVVNIDDFARPMARSRLLEHRPVMLWPQKKDERVECLYNEQREKVWLDSGPLCLVALGKTDAANFKLSLRFEKHALAGRAGIFFGYKPSSAGEGQTSVSYQDVIVETQRDEANESYLAISRYIRSFNLVAGKLRSPRGERVATAPIANFGPELPILEISVADSHLRSVSWRGQECKALRGGDGRTLGAGAFGVTNYSGSTSFSQADFTLLERDP